jgi:hypothetical protein
MLSWLELIEHYPPTSAILVIGTKADLVRQRKVSAEAAR